MANNKTPRRRDDDIDNIRPRDEDRRETDRENYDGVSDGTSYDRRDRDYGNDRYRNRGSLGWLWPILLFLAILLLLGWLFQGGKIGNIYNVNQNQQNQDQKNNGQEFESARNTGNFQKSIPKQAETIQAPPSSILIQTNTPVVQNSNIAVNKDNKDYGVGDTVISSNGQTLQRNIDQNAPDGIYTVSYKTCGSDGNCQDGSYQFRVDRSKTEGFENQKDKNNVTISYTNGKFYPENVLVSKGTKVTWVNNNANEFTIQSGEVGTTNYFVSLKSSSVSPNQKFSYTFGQAGYYPYYATVDGQSVNGKVVVQ